LVDSVRIFEYVGAVGSFQIPVWPIRLITLLGLATTLICFALLASADLQRLLRRRHHE
jgi:type VI protein secretion system component VasF